MHVCFFALQNTYRHGLLLVSDGIRQYLYVIISEHIGQIITKLHTLVDMNILRLTMLYSNMYLYQKVNKSFVRQVLFANERSNAIGCTNEIELMFLYENAAILKAFSKGGRDEIGCKKLYYILFRSSLPRSRT